MTTLFQRAPVGEMPVFEMNLDRVTLSSRSIDSAICCVQSFGRDPLFTQREFFSENGVSMLLSAVKIAGTVCEDSVYDPWNVILPEGYAAVVADLKRAYDVVVVRRKDARDTSERWFGVASIKSSVVGETSGQQGVRISNVVEVGEVGYLPQSASTPQIPAPVLVTKTLQSGNGRKVRRQIQSRSSVDLSSMVSRLCCPRDGGFTLMTPNLPLPWKTKIKLFPRAKVAVVIVLRQSFSHVPDYCTYQIFNCILVFRVFS